jgi:MoaA/NifB/PqqE/SkfB family radical SAM enzyme
LVNICNLHCSYCFRSEDDLYSSKAEYFPLQLLEQVLRDSKRVAGVTRVIFTGGEPTLHPQFSEALSIVAGAGMTSSFVTNGWHFERIWPAVLSNRDSITHVAFSLDGICREAHDRWRGAGSFDRLVRAFSRCHMSGLPFTIKIAIRRDTTEQLEQIAIFAARLGASALNFVHIMPTSNDLAGAEALNLEERRIAEEEIAVLSRIFKMHIGIDVGYYNIDDSPPCSPLAGTTMNVDYRGRLSLCCNLSGFRGGVGVEDTVADLNSESFESAHHKLRGLAAAQLKKRRERLAELRDEGATPDLFTGSPCLYCLQSFGKIPWSEKLYKVAVNVVND